MRRTEKKKYGIAFFLIAMAATEALGEDWPMWRGPRGDGVSLESNVPLHWSPDQNIVWKIPIPGRGRSSPIVSGDSVFLTTVMPDSQSRRLIKVDRRTGMIEWNQEIWNGPTEEQHRFNSSASSTPATDGRTVYCAVVDSKAMHVAAMDFDGNLKWRVSPGSFESKHGFASSPVLFKNRVIVNGHQDGSAFLVAIDCNTGSEVWRYVPDIHLRSFSTPLLIDFEGIPQLIVTGANQTVGLDPESGKRIWHVDGPTEKSVSTPSFGSGYVYSFAGSPSPKGMAIRLGGHGDVSSTHVAWRSEKAMPYVPSPLFVNNLLHVIDDMGIYSCLEPSSGKVLKITRRGGNTYSSPVYAENRIYLFEDSGRCTVIASDANFTILAKNELGEGTQCTPAISQHSLFIRSDNHLWRIGQEP